MCTGSKIIPFVWSLTLTGTSQVGCIGEWGGRMEYLDERETEGREER
jgi:hypothetical protein